MVGAQLTAQLVDPTLDQIDWQTCGAPSGTNLATDTDTYTLAIGDANTDVCAVETNALGVQYISDPVGPVSGVAVGPVISGDPVQGQTLSVTQGQWGAGAAVSDVWEDCDAAGTGCRAVASGATGPQYTLTRADAGDLIMVRETATAADGQSSSATSAPVGPATASVPVDTVAPVIAGTPALGETLTASPGTWTNDPTGYAYAWERCSAGRCSPIPGATSATYVPTAADVGSVLEVVVTASVLSSAGTPYPSYPTTTVTRTAAHRHVARRRPGHVGATMRWTFRYTPAYTQVIELEVRGASLGSRVTLRCAGRGCPFAIRHHVVRRPRHCRAHGAHRCSAPQTIDLTSSFTGHHLRAAATVTVVISHPRDIGKQYRFVVHAGKPPGVSTLACLAPGSTRLRRSCPR